MKTVTQKIAISFLILMLLDIHPCHKIHVLSATEYLHWSSPRPKCHVSFPMSSWENWISHCTMVKWKLHSRLFALAHDVQHTLLLFLRYCGYL